MNRSSDVPPHTRTIGGPEPRTTSAVSHVCYVTTRYPAVSHTFIEREIAELRRNGMVVSTAAQRPSTSTDLLTDAHRAEAADTFACAPQGWRGWAAGLSIALRHPGAATRSARAALRTGLLEPQLVAKRLGYLVSAWRLWAWTSRRGVEHLHAHFAQGPAMIAMLASEFDQAVRGPGGHSMSWSFTMHGPHEFHDETLFALASLTTGAHYVICISDYARSQLMRHLPAESWDKLWVHHCGVDPAVFVPHDGPGPDGSSAAHVVTVLTVARLDPMKGHTVLVDAVAHVLRAGVHIRLVIVGEGPTRPEVEAQIRRHGIADSVELLGAQDQEAVRSLLAAADIFALPSFGEGVPVVLMEAMSCGLPVVTTRIAGIPELVEDGRSGLVVSPGRPDMVADGLIRLVRDPQLRAAMGSCGRAKVVEEFDITTIGPAIASLHRSRGGASSTS